MYGTHKWAQRLRPESWHKSTVLTKVNTCSEQLSSLGESGYKRIKNWAVCFRFTESPQSKCVHFLLAITINIINIKWEQPNYNSIDKTSGQIKTGNTFLQFSKDEIF